ncbi:hypothetical protein V8C42DRAFT_347601 [Trichoderma barbatum]
MPEQAEAEGLSIKIPLLTNNRGSQESAKTFTLAAYWKETKTDLERFVTHLQSIDDLEYPASDMGQRKIVLSCAEGPPKTGETRGSSQINWLHLNGPTMNLDIFYNLIMSCHLIRDELKTVSMKLIDKVRGQFLRHSENGPYIEPGSMLRDIGTYPQTYAVPLSKKYQPTVPVVFVASPFLAVSPLREHWGSGRKEDHHPRTLLQKLYGFDVAPNRDKTQIIRKIFRGKQPNVALHVKQMWCLLIGSNILITMSDHTSDEVLSGAMEKRASDQEPPIKIKIKKRSDFNYYDDLRYLETEILTAERWIEIQAYEVSGVSWFQYRQRPKEPSAKRRDFSKKRISDGRASMSTAIKKIAEANPHFEPPAQNNAGGAKVPSPDSQNSLAVAASIKHAYFPGYLKPEVISIPSSSKEGSIYTGEDCSTLQAPDDVADQMMTRQNSDAGDPCHKSKSALARDSQSPDNKITGDVDFKTMPLGINYGRVPSPEPLFYKSPDINVGVPPQNHKDKPENPFKEIPDYAFSQ